MLSCRYAIGKHIGEVFSGKLAECVKLALPISCIPGTLTMTIYIESLFVRTKRIMQVMEKTINGYTW